MEGLFSEFYGNKCSQGCLQFTNGWIDRKTGG